MNAFWKVTSREGPPDAEGAKLYIYRPGSRVRVAVYRGRRWCRGRRWWNEDGEYELTPPYCWANLEDLPPAPAERAER